MPIVESCCSFMGATSDVPSDFQASRLSEDLRMMLRSVRRGRCQPASVAVQFHHFISASAGNCRNHGAID